MQLGCRTYAVLVWPGVVLALVEAMPTLAVEQELSPDARAQETEQQMTDDERFSLRGAYSIALGASAEDLKHAAKATLDGRAFGRRAPASAAGSELCAWTSRRRSGRPSPVPRGSRRSPCATWWCSDRAAHGPG